MKTNAIRFIFLFLVSALSCATAQAQFGKRLGKAVENAAKNATVRKAEQKTDQAVNKAIDTATDPNTYKGDGEGGNSDAATNSASTQSGNTEQDAGTATLQTAQDKNAGQATESIEMAYAKSDFVPGDEIIFEDNQANEQLGEFPSQWDLDRGNAEIASIGGVKCINLIGYTSIMPLIEPAKEFLPDKFTLEWDYFVVDDKEMKSCDMDLGMNSYNFFCFRLPTGATPYMSCHWTKPDNTGGNTSEQLSLTPNKWHHVSVSFNQRAMKIYVDGVRVVNAPNMQKPSSFYLFGREGIYIKNIRLAKGAVPLYDRMMTDGKFITYGITFDVGKSTIKPESMGEINRIITLMTENPDLKFSVEGHTDNTGNSASNQTLSEDRSKAIVEKLIEMGIATDRLSSAGKGQNNPIADNSTDEGRAKNRRVEFVKI